MFVDASFQIKNEAKINANVKLSRIIIGIEYYINTRPYSRRKVRPTIGRCRLMLKKEIF